MKLLRIIVAFACLFVFLAYAQQTDIPILDEDETIFPNIYDDDKLMNISGTDADNINKDVFKNTSNPEQERLRSLENILKELTQKLNKKTLREKIDNIIIDIRLGKFEEAEENISQLQLNEIKLVVEDLYNGRNVNFSTLIAFTKSLVQKDRSYYIVNALWDEIKKNGHLELNNLMPLYETVSNEIIKLSSTPDIMTDALRIQAELYKVIKYIAIEIMKKPVLEGNYVITETIETLVHSLGTLSEDLLDEVQRNVIDDVFTKADDKARLVDFMCDKRYPLEIVTSAVHIFEKLQHDLNNPAIAHIGQHLVTALKWNPEHGHSLSINKKNSTEEVFNKLPQPVRALSSGKKICIPSTNKEDFVIAVNYTFDSDRRFVIASPNLEGRKWRPVHLYNSTYYFINDAYREYMYASEQYPLGRLGRWRKVFTYIPEDALNNQFAWIVELNGDEVFIKNKEFNDYLCYRYSALPVFTKWLETEKCSWKIEICS